MIVGSPGSFSPLLQVHFRFFRFIFRLLGNYQKIYPKDVEAPAGGVDDRLLGPLLFAALSPSLPLDFLISVFLISTLFSLTFFYTSSACIYPEFKQLETNVSLKESDASPAEPQDADSLEKLATEELCKHYNKDFGIECRIGRFHNIYGPFGTWKGGREKAPTTFCRNAQTSTDKFDMWGDGMQTRYFTFIDE